MIDLQSLPPPSVVEQLAYETIVQQHKAKLADGLRQYLPSIDEILKLESEPLVKLIETHALHELFFRADVNDRARQHLLAFANGTNLDHLAAMFGVERMEGESDDRLRMRLQLRIAALGAQGTREHYEFHAMTASLLVRAVRASQSAPGIVLVMLWVADPVQAPAVRAAVEAALNSDAARMLGVTLTIAAAVPKPINITARITRTRSAPGELLASLETRVRSAFAEMGTMSGTVPRSYITALLHVDGVHAVEFPDAAAPAEITAIGAGEYPALGVLQLVDAGVM